MQFGQCQLRADIPQRYAEAKSATKDTQLDNARLSQGSNSWNVSCTNQSGYVSNSSPMTVLVDSIAPVAAVNSINGRASSGLATANDTLAVNFTASDANINNWTLSVKNSSGDLLKNWTGYANNLSTVLGYTVGLNGTYFVDLSVLDNASTVSTALFNITVDQSDPVINSLSTSSITTSGATLTVNVTDTYSGISTCAYSGAGSGNLSLNSGLYTASLTGLSASTAYTVTVNCTDNADNSATNTTSFTTTTSAISPSGSGSSGGGGGGSSGGGGGSANWSCNGWSACSSEGISTKTCTLANSTVTSIKKQSCTPAQTTVASQNATVPTAQQTAASGSAGTTGQGTNGVTPTGGNPITGQAIAQGVKTPSWPVTALVLLAVLGGLVAGGYFFFRNRDIPLADKPRRFSPQAHA